MPRARARISAIVLGAVLGPALGCTFIVQFDDPDDADAGVVGDATVPRDGKVTGTTSKPDATGANVDDADDSDQDGEPTEGDSGQGDDDGAVVKDAGPPSAIFVNTNPGTQKGAPSACDPCGGATTAGWRCADTIANGCSVTSSTDLIYCSGDAGPALAYFTCPTNCIHLGGGFVDICNPCSGDPTPTGACVPYDNDPGYAAYSVVCSTMNQAPQASDTRACELADCGTGCGAP